MDELIRILPLLEQLAPTIASVIGTPLLGGAMAALENALGIAGSTNISVDERAAAVTQAIEVASPETLAAIRKADQDYAAKMTELGFKNKEMLTQLTYQTQKLDVNDAINTFVADKSDAFVYNLALCILFTFGVLMVAVLWGCYTLLTGGLPMKEIGAVAAVSGLVGSIVGYAAANAQTVVNFLYGGSLQSSKNIGKAL